MFIEVVTLPDEDTSCQIKVIFDICFATLLKRLSLMSIFSIICQELNTKISKTLVYMQRALHTCHFHRGRIPSPLIPLVQTLHTDI